jgi:N-acetylneuraminic acid mutarotase
MSVIPANARSVGLAVALALAAALGYGAASGESWEARSPLPEPRSEVAGTLWRGQIVVAGGFVADGGSSARVDLFDPERNRWARLPDLPLAVNHAMAAADGGQLYVVGGYADGRPSRQAFVLAGTRWRKLPAMPEGRAAAGAAVARDLLYVVGGVGPAGLAREMLVYDARRDGWVSVAGPTPREHLGVVALGGRIYAVGGRRAGFDTNLDLLEVFRPARGYWAELPPVPEARGGTGLATAGGLLISVGGEDPGGSIASVYAYDRGERRWARLANMRTPRHGLAAVGRGSVVYAVGGGPEPGLSQSGANEALRVR